MTILRDISIVWSLLHVIVLFAFLFEPRLPRKKAWIVCGGAMVPWIALNGVLYVVLGPARMGQTLLLTATLPSLIFFWLLDEYRDGRFFFTFCAVDTVSYSIVVLTSVIEYYIFDNHFIFMLLSRLIAFPLVEYLVWRYLRDFYRELQSSVTRGWGLFAVASALFYVMLVLSSSYPVIFYENPGQTPILLLMIGLMGLMYANIFQILYVQQKAAFFIEEDRRQEQQTRLLRNELEAERQSVEDARRYRHDLHHHAMVVLSYLEEGNVEDAKHYLGIFRKYMDDAVPVRYCSNTAVNALMRISNRRCALSEVDFRVEGDVPVLLPLTEPETVAVFGNLLENACDASGQCQNGYLYIKSEIRQSILYIEVRNSVSGKVAFVGDYPKSAKRSGGVGIHSINKILKRHDGMLSCRQEGEMFLTRIVLPL